MFHLYTCDQVADRYQVKTVTIWNWIRTKKLPAIKLGNEYRIREQDLWEFEQKHLTVPKKVAAE